MLRGQDSKGGVMTSIENEINACEQRLRRAMLQSDVRELDALLSADLVFTNHLGHLLSKQDDLDAHASGTLRIKGIEVLHSSVRVLADSAVVVSALVNLSGEYAGNASQGEFRFTRVWTREDGQWRIICAHACVVV